MNNSWELIGSTLLVYNKKNVYSKKNISMAGFDIDGTIICTKSGKVHPENYEDWIIKYSECKKIIEELACTGYSIVFITNQSKLETTIGIDKYKTKIENICKCFDCNISVFVAMSNDKYRKPRPMIVNECLDINKSKSFYCGDAAGRDRNINSAKDFSDSDYKFALNVKISFYTPDELLSQSKRETRKKNISYPANIANIEHKNYPQFSPSEREVIINSGYPGSGKSYYTNKYIVPHGYKYINQDKLHTFDKCLKELKKALISGQNVVMDNTNPDKEKRERIIKLSHEYKFKVRSIHFKTNESLSIHNSHYRNIKSNNTIKPIPKIAYNIYKKKFKKPTLSEGFYKIEELDYVLEDGIDYGIYNMMLS